MKITKIVLIFSILLGFSCSGFTEETIRLTNGEWIPFLSEDLKHYGVISRIVKEAFALEGMKVEYVIPEF